MYPHCAAPGLAAVLGAGARGRGYCPVVLLSPASPGAAAAAAVDAAAGAAGVRASALLRYPVVSESWSLQLVVNVCKALRWEAESAAHLERGCRWDDATRRWVTRDGRAWSGADRWDGADKAVKREACGGALPFDDRVFQHRKGSFVAVKGSGPARDGFPVGLPMGL
jgi:hypothetical protein